MNRVQEVELGPADATPDRDRSVADSAGQNWMAQYSYYIKHTTKAEVIRVIFIGKLKLKSCLWKVDRGDGAFDGGKAGDFVSLHDTDITRVGIGA